MAVSDNTILLVAALLINHLVIYRKNGVIGSILITIIGIASYLYMGADTAWGIILATIGLISFVYSVFWRR